MSLSVANLSHSYETPGLVRRTVIQPIASWRLEPGTQALLRGISGSGKTTLFNILAGLLQPTTGEVFLKGQSLYALSEAERDRFRRGTIGYVFQMHHLLPHLNAQDNTIMPLAFSGWAPKERQARALELLEQMGLAEHARHLPAQLSAGQRLRVAVARALAAQPVVLLADEPTAALDRDAACQVMDLIQDTCRRYEAILLVASHDPGLDDRFDQVIDLVQGNLHQAIPGGANGHRSER